MDEAEEACNNEKAHLVSILDEKENTKVQQLAAQNSVSCTFVLYLSFILSVRLKLGEKYGQQ